LKDLNFFQSFKELEKSLSRKMAVECCPYEVLYITFSV